MRAKDTRYSYPLKLDKGLKDPVKKIAKSNRRKINDEINIAVTEYVERNKEKAK